MCVKIIPKSPLRFRCIALSTAMVTGKESSLFISVCVDDFSS